MVFGDTGKQMSMDKSLRFSCIYIKPNDKIFSGDYEDLRISMAIGDFINTMENIEYGILMAIILVAILLFSVTAFNSKKALSICSYIIAVALVIPLAFQSSRLIAAFQISDTASTINGIVGAVSPTLGKYISSATNSNIGWFIFRRILWMLVFLIFATVGIVATMVPKGCGRSFHSAGYKRVSSRKADDRRPSRRR